MYTYDTVGTRSAELNGAGAPAAARCRVYIAGPPKPDVRTHLAYVRKTVSVQRIHSPGMPETALPFRCRRRCHSLPPRTPPLRTCQRLRIPAFPFTNMAHVFLTVTTLLISAVLAAPSWNNVPVSEPYVPRSESSFTLCGGNKLCLLGGRGSDPVSILDTKSLSWSKGENPPQEIHHFQALQGPDNCAWVVGAWTGAYPAESTVDSILKYCPDTNQWSTGPSIERPRGAGGAVLYNGAVYLVSGNVGGHNINANLVTWFDKFDLDTEKWSQLPDVPNRTSPLFV